MRKVVASVALALVLTTTPGLVEVAENALHWVCEGHGAHAKSAHDHDPADAEHGCSGPFHVCPCHQSLAFDAAPGMRLPAILESAVQLVAPAAEALPAAPVRAIYRPPIA